MRSRRGCKTTWKHGRRFFRRGLRSSGVTVTGGVSLGLSILRFNDRPRILSPYLATSNRFALDESRGFLGLTDTTILYDNSQPEDLRWFVGFLNSKALTFRVRGIAKLKSKRHP
jgi:hypothetical protein